MRIQLFNFLSVSAASLALCCACVEEIEPADIPDGPQPLVFTAGQLLPEGKYPVALSASIDEATRATVDGSWSGGESVAIQAISQGGGLGFC